MKTIKTKIGLSVLAICTFALMACNGGGGEAKSSTSKKSKYSFDDASTEVKKVKVTIKGATDQVLDVELGSALTKPADPAAPAGKTFYGWMQKDNAGRIWDFDDPVLNQVMEDMTLEPCFVDAGINPQLLEAELCKSIMVGPDGEPMQGSTYSGGSAGKGLIYKDYDNLYKCTAPASIDYIDTIVGKTYSLWEEVDPSFMPEQKHLDLEFTAFVHNHYVRGNTLTFDIVCDKAATNVTMFGHFGGEYGNPSTTNPQEDILVVTDEDFLIKVNGQPVKFGTLTIHNIKNKEHIPFEDFLLSTSVNLNAGNNTIEMVVNNDIPNYGGVKCVAPCIDSLKLITSSAITWPTARYANLAPGTL